MTYNYFDPIYIAEFESNGHPWFCELYHYTEEEAIRYAKEKSCIKLYKKSMYTGEKKEVKIC